MTFDAATWAASVFGCGRAEAIERLKNAAPDDLSIGREEANAGGMTSLRRRAASGDRDALRTCREIELAFAACDHARLTGAPCKVCGPVTIYTPAAAAALAA